VVFNDLTGMEGWFTLPGHKVGVPPPKYKMAVVGMFGASPFVLLIIPLLVAYLSPVVPPVLMSTVMTWVTMPLTTRMLRRWLYPTS
jgi:antibiotic biosynthesis monooxygenase (ABM) superfamily enzyme